MTELTVSYPSNVLACVLPERPPMPDWVGEFHEYRSGGVEWRCRVDEKGSHVGQLVQVDAEGKARVFQPYFYLARPEDEPSLEFDLSATVKLFRTVRDAAEVLVQAQTATESWEAGAQS